MAIEPEPLVFPVARGSSPTFWFIATIVGVLLLLSASLLLVPYWPGSVELVVSRDGLQIRGSVYGRTIAHPDSTFTRCAPVFLPAG